MLIGDFAKLVLIALTLIVPVIYFSADNWLVNFAARIELNLWLFVIPGITVMTFAVLAVSYHATRASLANPVSSLRYE